MTDDQLQELVRKVSRSAFKRDFKHHAFFNQRLRTTGGRYLLTDHNIEINPRMLSEHDLDTLIGVIKHELCHYHLHLTGKGYLHRDSEFKKLLRQVGGSRYAPRSAEEERNLCYCCSKCGQQYFRRRRVNTKRYVCSKCLGNLILIRKSK
ncbi:hypothetical protein FC19_GL001418 [Liquorilactobacillus aquaticus DSM 21051]|uniref:SprT-like domain-containing protein n=1 Tax=Liquorilactobacillus aquaticus DSM 21051 TaxID=1423725 RepID=A0A0R2CXF9_9LACO|nr:SprT family protein [Liquorilactobacillus aquaticus]KRM95938.1 hypothetical protein FC19_GL001418 [Liquorilactobacillus aquaticus DSM 21051]